MSAAIEKAISKALQSKTIAVVGLSKNPAKASRDVAAYLKSHGYQIIPINPTAEQILGETCYPSLLDLPDDLKRRIEAVDIFREADDVPPIVDQAIELHGRYALPITVWMQLGIVNESAAQKAGEAGLSVVMDRCMMAEHKRRLG